jgi:hypothetical protein
MNCPYNNLFEKAGILHSENSHHTVRRILRETCTKHHINLDNRAKTYHAEN